MKISLEHVYGKIKNVTKVPSCNLGILIFQFFTTTWGVQLGSKFNALLDNMNA